MPCFCSSSLVLPLQLVDVISAIDDQLQRVGIDRLLIEIIGADSHRTHGVLLVAMTGDDDHLGRRHQRQNLLQRGDPLADAFRIRRQTEILQHHRRLVAAQLGQCARPVLGNQNLIIGEAPLELALQARVVLDHKKLPALVCQGSLR